MSTDAGTQTTTSMRAFVVVWLGQLVSITGTTLTAFGLQFFIYTETGSVTRVAAIALSYALPAVALAPIAGSVVDRADRRVVMLASDLLAGSGTAALLWWVSAGTPPFWFICLAVAVGSSANAFQDPAWLASIPVLVPRAQLGRANGMVQLNLGVSVVVAPLLAGALLAAGGLRAVLIVDLVSFGVGVLTLAAVRFPPYDRDRSPDRTVRSDSGFAWRYLRERPGLFWLLWIYAGVNFMMSMTNVLLIPLVLSFATATALGVILSISGVGAVVGSLIVSTYGEPKRLVRTIMLGIGVSGLLTALAGTRASLLIIGIPTVLVLLLNPIVNGASQVVWQTKVAEGAQGRVFSLRRMIGQAISPIAILLAGPLADGIFEPALASGGALAGSVGELIGTGTGRGIGFLYVLAGLAITALAVIGWLLPHVRNIERELPDLAGRT
ncbi:MAG: MFS transporter [Acidimicrobiia bacterium]|nr:MFS transporter [Acidimicrobiia bacterium]